jgi:hypothetical protein
MQISGNLKPAFFKCNSKFFKLKYKSYSPLLMNPHIVNIYTDGASRGNPGRGGYGAILIWGKIKKELSAGYKLTTNNRMELMAVIAALETLKKDGLQLEIYSVEGGYHD